MFWVFWCVCRAITGANHLQQSYASIYVYDITSVDSFVKIQSIVEATKSVHHENQVNILCGNKTDLAEQRSVETAQAQDLATSLGMLFFECSAKQGENVTEMFMTAANQVLEKFPFAPASRRFGDDMEVGGVYVTEKNSKCCSSCCSSCTISWEMMKEQNLFIIETLHYPNCCAPPQLFNMLSHRTVKDTVTWCFVMLPHRTRHVAVGDLNDESYDQNLKKLYLSAEDNTKDLKIKCKNKNKHWLEALKLLPFFGEGSSSLRCVFTLASPLE
jgi:hypothetical protein